MVFTQYAEGHEVVIAGFGDFCMSRYFQMLSLRDFESMSCSQLAVEVVLD